MTPRVTSALLLAIGATAAAQSDLSREALTMLQDPLGWRYASMEEEKNGRRIFRGCFDNRGQPHPSVCGGNLTLASNGRFTQRVQVKDRATTRRGTYRLQGNELTLTDESRQVDGPYTVKVFPEKLLWFCPRSRTASSSGPSSSSSASSRPG